MWTWIILPLLSTAWTITTAADDKLQKYEFYVDWKAAAWSCVKNVGGPLVNLVRVPFNWTVWDKLKSTLPVNDNYWVGGYKYHTPLHWIYGCYDFEIIYNMTEGNSKFLFKNSVKSCAERCASLPSRSSFIGLKGMLCYCVPDDIASHPTLKPSKCENGCLADRTSRDKCGGFDKGVSVYKRLNRSEIETSNPATSLDANINGTCVYLEKTPSGKIIWGTAECSGVGVPLCRKPGVPMREATLKPLMTPVSWDSAISMCQKSDLYLAYVTLSDTMDPSSRSLFQSLPPGQRVWVGLYRHDINVWIDDDTPLYEPKTCTVVYKNPTTLTLKTKNVDCNETLKPICQATMTLTADGAEIGTPAPTTVPTTTTTTATTTPTTTTTVTTTPTTTTTATTTPTTTTTATTTPTTTTTATTTPTTTTTATTTPTTTTTATTTPTTTTTATTTPTTTTTETTTPTTTTETTTTTEITSTTVATTTESTTQEATTTRAATTFSTEATIKPTIETITTQHTTTPATTIEETTSKATTTEATTTQASTTVVTTTELTTEATTVAGSTKAATTEATTTVASTTTIDTTVTESTSTLATSPEDNKRATTTAKATFITTEKSVTSTAASKEKTTTFKDMTSVQGKLHMHVSTAGAKWTTAKENKPTQTETLLKLAIPTSKSGTPSLPSEKISDIPHLQAVGERKRGGDEEEEAKTELMVVLIVFFTVLALTMLIVIILVVRYRRKHKVQKIPQIQTTDIRFKEEEELFIKAYRLSAEASNPSPKPLPRIDVDDMESNENIAVNVENGNLKKFDSFGSVPWIDASRSTLDKISLDEERNTVPTKNMTSFSVRKSENFRADGLGEKTQSDKKTDDLEENKNEGKEEEEEEENNISAKKNESSGSGSYSESDGEHAVGESASEEARAFISAPDHDDEETEV